MRPLRGDIGLSAVSRQCPHQLQQARMDERLGLHVLRIKLCRSGLWFIMGLVCRLHAGPYGLRGAQPSVETGWSHWNQIGDFGAARGEMPDLDDLLGGVMTWAQPQYLLRRKAREDALPPGAALEDADLWPLLLLIDSERRQVPHLVFDRVRAQDLNLVHAFSLADVEASRLLPAWQQAQFRTSGFTLIALPMPALIALPRGRRQLEVVEAHLFEALRLWTFALRPALKLLIKRAPSLEKTYPSEMAYLAVQAPDLVAISATPMRQKASDDAKVRNARDVESHDVLCDFLDQLGREGRRSRVSFATEGSDRSFFGDALADRMLARIKEQLLADVPETAAGLAPLCARLLNTLAKGRRLAQLAFEQRPLDMRAYEEGMEKLAPLAMPEVLAAPGHYGNRLHAAAGRVYQAQLARRLVQPPTLREADRLTAAEMATLAFLADIDPYQISAQHVLLRPEIWAAREIGAEAFLRRDGDARRMAALRHLLADDTRPTAAVLKQPLVPELASIAGMIRDLCHIFP
ncbi:hypothetical protein GL279_15320 [Paracoccus limosus]|uniref:Uncharacterized protein n=1 Tax=Paracoccus limosus TaxID=913252 RepID=A0A844H7E8_9RHOB|nr:hypothetical protein [Paracoccus limosus]MTH35975.1 hypothetical protein [Paracoccus limosus]